MFLKKKSNAKMTILPKAINNLTATISQSPVILFCINRKILKNNKEYLWLGIIKTTS